MISFFKYLVTTLMLVILGLSLTWLTFWKFGGARLYSLESNSMKPAISRGDLVVNRRIDPAAIKPGEIISYTVFQNSGQIITHRVVRTDIDRGYLLTKGDNLSQPDPIVPLTAVKGKSILIIPKLGYVYDALHTPAGLITLVYVPGMLIAFSEIWILASQFHSKRYLLT